MKRNHTGHRIGECHGKAKHGDDVVQRARELYESLHSYRKVAEIVGAGESTVRDWVKYWTRWDA